MGSTTGTGVAGVGLTPTVTGTSGAVGRTIRWVGMGLGVLAGVVGVL